MRHVRIDTFCYASLRYSKHYIPVGRENERAEACNPKKRKRKFRCAPYLFMGFHSHVCFMFCCAHRMDIQQS